MHLHSRGRRRGHGCRGRKSRRGPARRRRALHELLQRIRVHHKPGLRIRRTLYVFHSHFRDEEAAGREKGRLGVAGLCNLVSCCFFLLISIRTPGGCKLDFRSLIPLPVLT